MNTGELISQLRNNLSRDTLVKQAGISNYTITKYKRSIITDLGSKIIELRKQGKSIKQIASELKCSKSTVSSYSYHIDPQHEIKKRCTQSYIQKRYDQSLLRKESDWLKSAKSRAYKGTFNRQMNHYDYRDEMIEACGGKCMMPGCNRIEGLHFHHIDPKTKKFELTARSRYTLDDWIIEVNKCSLLCAGCHMIVHKNFITDLPRCKVIKDDINMSLDINNLEIRNIDRTTLDFFCSTLHYLNESHKGAKYCIGYYHKNKLIAISLVNNPTRHGSLINGEPTLELSRFLILGKYRVPNLASKCLSLLIKFLRQNDNKKWLISFADTGHHIGTIYKASNFREIGVTKSSYNYDGIHKKTIYERAKNMGLSEYEYARLFNLSRIKEDPKIKFSYQLIN